MESQHQAELEVANTDMILVLSSELVCQLAEKYFNSTMLKQKVNVIDLQVASNGLIQFMLQFKKHEKVIPLILQEPIVYPDEPVRNSNGRFARKVKQNG